MLYFLPPDHYVFSRAVQPESPDGRHGDLARLTALRHRLLEIVGDENTLSLLCRLATGEITCGDVADALGRHRTTVWRWRRELERKIEKKLVAQSKSNGHNGNGRHE